MREETNEDFGRDDRNFHPEEQKIYWETMQNKDPEISEDQHYDSNISYKTDRNNYTDSDSENNKRTEQDLEPELDRDLDDALDEELDDYSDEDFDKKDQSDS
jgi:hypothetical protein